MIDLQSINAIIFDLGNVIYDIRYENISDQFRKFGVVDFDKLYSQAGQTEEIDLFEEGKISPARFRNYIRSLTDVPLTDEQIDQGWNAIMIDIPECCIEMLKRLQQQYRVFLFSNTNQINCEYFTQYVIDKFGYNIFNHHFEKAYYSHTLQIKKPKPEAFQRIIEENHLDPAKTLFIDDIERHLKGAQSVGLRTYHHAAGNICDFF
jgi:putative hydrolase of the HAD superfamily